ncbi:MAG TPA: HPr(Ser) kinase/phosphatase [Gaiellaceae bacterium]|nr:HPr(Ser) kinase/phosphatase [Gaiellaceae bacterium]
MTVAVRELLEQAGPSLGLELVAGARGLERAIAVPRLQQPGLALAGYLPQLHPDRMQVLGNSEVSYLGTLEPAAARERVAAVADAGVACFVVTNGTPAPPVLIEPAEAAGVPVLASRLRTADLIRAATAWLEDRLAPETRLHGDLVDMHGLGVLILGKSGIGKSEAALDLVSRGHRLVADDVIEIRRISPTVLRGRAAPLLAHHMEIRGLGVIDVEALFGTLAILDERTIDMVVELVEWPGNVDRLGLVEGSYALLEVELPLVRIPVRPGRSIAMLIETAARNHLLRRRGRHSAHGFADRLDDEIASRRRERAGEPG